MQENHTEGRLQMETQVGHDDFIICESLVTASPKRCRLCQPGLTRVHFPSSAGSCWAVRKGRSMLLILPILGLSGFPDLVPGMGAEHHHLLRSCVREPQAGSRRGAEPPTHAAPSCPKQSSGSSSGNIGALGLITCSCPRGKRKPKPKCSVCRGFFYGT